MSEVCATSPVKPNLITSVLFKYTTNSKKTKNKDVQSNFQTSQRQKVNLHSSQRIYGILTGKCFFINWLSFQLYLDAGVMARAACVSSL